VKTPIFYFTTNNKTGKKEKALTPQDKGFTSFQEFAGIK
jgi:hypothetical protein